MSESTEITFKPTFFTKRQKIVLNPDFIEFYQSPEDRNPIKFSKLEIDGFRFGVRWVSGYQFYIGRIYCIDIKNTAGKIIKVRLKSMYKINVKQLRKKYNVITNTVFKFYFTDSVLQYLKAFNYKQPLSILNVQFNQTGIIVDNKHDIEWNNLDIKSYTRYIAISTKENSNIYKPYDYIIDWNVWVLYNVIKQILKNKKLLN